MMEPVADEQAEALLYAAERSLFDATVRLEQALAALGQRSKPGAKAKPTLEQARLWSSLIQAGLVKLEQRVERAA
ncbi:MAG: hypothetical protein KDK70_18785 [Myxococcales bacterium]|nr:hypothetical protein [Myxococcales bacterium]